MAVFYRRIIFFVMLETRICLFKLQPGFFLRQCLVLFVPS